MTSTEPRQWASATSPDAPGVTERTLRHYDELGLLAPAHDAGCRRRYDGGALDGLYRVRLLRKLGMP